MFGLFKSKSPIEKLEEKHQKLLEEAYRLSRINRADGDQKYAEADKIAKEIDALKDK